LAPLIRQDLLRAFREMSQTLGITVVIVEQQVDEALGYADRAVVLDHGTVAMTARRTPCSKTPRPSNALWGWPTEAIHATATH